MLQIMSGKFFQGADRFTSPGKGILYSNFSWVRPIETCVGTLEPVDRYTTAPGYVFSYVNQMEKRGEPKAGDLATTGDREIVSDFSLLAMFALNASFDVERSTVLFNCRASRVGGHERYVPCQYVDKIFQADRHGTVEDEARLINFVDKAIALPRAHYKALLSVLHAMQRAYYAINESLDLAYSMVVYCLESLAQKFDSFEPSWPDYDDRPRRAIDKILQDVTPAAGEQLRGILLEGAHLKLRKRFIHFVSDYLSEDYFTYRTHDRKGSLRKSQLERGLSNAYDLRSGYVHSLRSIQDHLHVPFIAENEVFVWERQPYLTLRGLLNLANDVIRNFVDRAPRLDTEEVNWREDLPGITRLRMAPQYWIGRHEGIESLTPEERIVDLKGRYHGLLQQVLDIALQPGSTITDLGDLLRLYERLLPQAPRKERPAIMATYILFHRLARSRRTPTVETIFEQFASCLDARTIEAMTLEVMLNDEVDGAFLQCLEGYQAYTSSRFSEKTLEVPALIEVKVVAAIANKALSAGELDQHAKLLDIAIGEAVGHVVLQARLLDAKTNRTTVDLPAIFTLPRVAQAQEAT